MAAFMLLTLAVVVSFAVVRFYTLGGVLQEQASEHLDREVELIVDIVADDVAAGRVIDRATLAPLVHDRQQLEVTYGGGTVVAGTTGPGSPGPDDLVVRRSRGEVAVTLRQSSDVVAQQIRANTPPLALTAGMVLLLAGTVGYWLSGTLVRPFRELARAAQALGRGRFDLALPTYSVPEAERIASALRASARQVQASLDRDRRFIHHVSHVLRTPLTGLRLELDDLAQRSDVQVDVTEAAERCLVKVERLDSEIESLIDLSRATGSAVGVPLEALARQVAQQWTDKLADHGRDLRATVDGEITLEVRPGPIEQLLDQVLGDVITRGSGAVSIGFDGAADQLRIRVVGGAAGVSPLVSPDPPAGHELVDGLGGRLYGDVLSPEGLEILLPVH